MSDVTWYYLVGVGAGGWEILRRWIFPWIARAAKAAWEAAKRTQ